MKLAGVMTQSTCNLHVGTGYNLMQVKGPNKCTSGRNGLLWNGIQPCVGGSKVGTTIT
jgi:hypothetical protein